ncbi:hypothetical protein [Scytonema hofmannii]|uniref:hypothetical protein n=1 Tax=Scytonema hofmannii TaxID=34078 RepID=UPI001313E465|nr:hypothetical protein [Scytonema hofmannii]
MSDLAPVLFTGHWSGVTGQESLNEPISSLKANFFPRTTWDVPSVSLSTRSQQPFSSGHWSLLTGH